MSKLGKNGLDRLNISNHEMNLLRFAVFKHINYYQECIIQCLVSLLYLLRFKVLRSVT